MLSRAEMAKAARAAPGNDQGWRVQRLTDVSEGRLHQKPNTLRRCMTSEFELDAVGGCVVTADRPIRW